MLFKMTLENSESKSFG